MKKSLKDKSKILKCCLLQFLFGALRVKVHSTTVVKALKYKSLRKVVQTVTFTFGDKMWVAVHTLICLSIETSKFISFSFCSN